MSSPSKHRASTTHSGRSRNDEDARRKGSSDSERGMASMSGKGGGGHRPPTPSAGPKGGR